MLRLALTTALALAPALPATAASLRGTPSVWQPLVLDIAGPPASEAGSPNPFLDYRVVVTFENGGRRIGVPGYYAADGDAAETGAESGGVWRAHFVPDTPGRWEYAVSFRSGSRIALSDDPAAGAPAGSDGDRGHFEIAEDPGAEGPLRYTGERYLRFGGSGRAFLKAGTDSPENLLAYADFDGTFGKPREGEGEARAGEAPLAPPHRYAPHEADWSAGGPSWRGGRGRGLVGALDYLASAGVNGVYFLTFNVAGDGDDVWPYTSRDERWRFDCSKLDQWEIVFSHMDALGILLHVVLTETENEDLFELEEGGVLFADARRLYYRELVARFSHHRALVWNLGEENGWDDRDEGGAAGRPNSDEQRRLFAEALRRLDPWDHPVVVHTLPGRWDDIYAPLLGHPAFEGASLQVGLGPQIHAQVLEWTRRSQAAGRPWVVTLDEIGPHTDGVLPDAVDPEHDGVRRWALWGTLMAGGAGVEWYFGYRYPNDDLNAEDFRSRAEMWRQSRLAVDFFQEHLPFAEMLPCDALVRQGEAWCLGKPEQVYAFYLPSAGAEVAVWLPERELELRWFDPRNGGALRTGTVAQVRGPGPVALGTPPGDPERDWVALLR